MRLALIGTVMLAISLGVYYFAFTQERAQPSGATIHSPSSQLEPLPPLDAHGSKGVEEISKAELIRRVTTHRLLTDDELANLNRGCPGLVCIYQRMGMTRWPESARGTHGYLTLADALRHCCSDGRENFIFVKQAWWVSGRPPSPDRGTGEVPLSSITREKPGWYSFNYAVYFPSTATYAWINHREFGFPLNLIKPETVYLSVSPPLDYERPAQIYCTTCR